TLTQREHYGVWGLVPAFGPVKRAAYPFRRVDADGRAWSYVAAVQRLLAEMDLERHVADIHVPTLLVYSHADAIVPNAQGVRLGMRMGDAAIVRSLPRATHYSLPFDPEAVAAVVRWIGQMQPAAEAV
ncbi:MAG TPA: alpha/beta hydrolase, partial [Longimicrobium sp.]|nr:alpha/beta hydrolase [Longimicrobium sp.]